MNLKYKSLMPQRFYFTLVVATALGLLPYTCLQGETSTTKPVVDSYKKQEQALSQKRFKQEKWSGGQQSDLMQKTFAFEHWNKNYSSLGSKKWDYSSEKASDRKRFKSDQLNFFKKNKEIELSDWQGYLANLESRARISTDTTARIIQDKRTYEMMLQQAENYKDTGETLSLRDINRFQFRRNRSADDVPITKVGSQEN